MNESKLKAAAMDSVGELPNLLLREDGYPHLPNPAFLPASQSDAWNDAGTKPSKAGVYETKGDVWRSGFQYWNGHFWGLAVGNKEEARFFADMPEWAEFTSWREVQP
jgi:hypothetical protein